MSGDRLYGWQKCRLADAELHGVASDLRARLLAALRHLDAIDEADLPASVGAMLRQIRTRSSWRADAVRGSRPATLEIVSDNEVAAIAALLAEIIAAVDAGCAP